MRRHIIAAAILFLTLAPEGRAETYNIVDYAWSMQTIPSPDYIPLGAITSITGTITPLVPGDFDWYTDCTTSLMMTAGGSTYIEPEAMLVFSGGLHREENWLTWNPSPSGAAIVSPYGRMGLYYNQHFGSIVNQVYALVVVDGPGGQYATYAASPADSPFWPPLGPPASNCTASGRWIIATLAPEPGAIDWQGGNISDPTNWRVAANWNPDSTVPNGPGTKVSFGNQPAADNVVDMTSQGQTVGSMTFFADTGTTIQSTGGFALTFDNSGNASTIDVHGTDAITAPVILANDAIIMGPGTLSLSGGISGPHNLDVYMDLTAKSIEVDTLTVDPGLTVTIEPIPGGPLALSGSFHPVPEPSSLILLGVGMVGLLVVARRREK